jgi:Fe-S oxidoreductase
MAKASYPGMRLHQWLGFSSLMLKIPQAEAIFWPGCALLNLDGEILQKTLTVLRRAEPEIKLACACCGQPTVYLFPEKAEKRKKKLVSLLKKQGVKRIYTACPNCTLQLRQLEGLEIIPIWPVLADHIRKVDIEGDGGQFIWNDPCPTRKDPAQQEAARILLEKSGCDCCQPECTGCKTKCCGNFHMMAASDPEKSRKMRLARLAEFPEEKIIASSCEGCLGAFRSEGRTACHLLEILFGRSLSRGWGNRIKTTIKRHLV